MKNSGRERCTRFTTLTEKGLSHLHGVIGFIMNNDL